METMETVSECVCLLADSAILKHPLLYFSEPGYWKVTGEEAIMLREFLDQGGFVIFDDFRGAGEWENLVSCMKKVYPDRSFQKLTGQEPLFQCPSTLAWSICLLPTGFRENPPTMDCSHRQGAAW